MIKRKEIKGNIFIAQTTYYIYRSEDDLQNDKLPFLITSNKKVFESYKKSIKTEKVKLHKS